MNNFYKGMATLGAILLTSAAPAAFAAGTEAGTSVSNSIDVSYSSGGETILIEDADTATFVVDRRVDLSLEGQDGGKTVTAAAGANDQVLSFLLTNEGNDASGYDVDIVRTGDLGLTYDPTGAGTDGTFYTVLSADNSFDAGDTVVDLTGDNNTLDLAADGQSYILVVANVAASTADGLEDEFTVTATALNAGTNTVSQQTPDASMTLAAEDTVFADTDNDGVESDLETLVVTAPQLTYSKTVAIVDENLDGALSAAACGTAAIDATATAAVPGACLEYTISISNGGSATSPASTIVISDTIPGEETFAGTATGDFDDVTYDAGTGPKGTVTGTLSTLAAGDSASFTLRVLVD